MSGSISCGRCSLASLLASSTVSVLFCLCHCHHCSVSWPPPTPPQQPPTGSSHMTFQRDGCCCWLTRATKTPRQEAHSFALSLFRPLARSFTPTQLWGGSLDGGTLAAGLVWSLCNPSFVFVSVRSLRGSRPVRGGQPQPARMAISVMLSVCMCVCFPGVLSSSLLPCQ